MSFPRHVRRHHDAHGLAHNAEESEQEEYDTEEASERGRVKTTTEVLPRRVVGSQQRARPEPLNKRGGKINTYLPSQQPRIAYCVEFPPRSH